MQSKYDVYDDTGTARAPTRARMREGQGQERDAIIVPHGPSPFAAMFEQIDREMDSMFRGMFRDMPSGLRSAVEGGGGSSTYMYESHTSVMGPDGRVRTETVITRPGRDGQPETQRILGDSEGYETSETFNELGTNSIEQFSVPFFREMFGDMRAPAPRVEIQDVTEEEEEHMSRGRLENSRTRIGAQEPRREEWAIQRWFRNWRANRS